MVEEREPKTLNQFRFHCIDIEYVPGEDECVGECPFCRKHKFCVNASNGLWKCWSCNTGGHSVPGTNDSKSFVKQYWKDCFENTTTEFYKMIAEDRGICNVEALLDWGVVASNTTRELMIPGYGIDKKLRTLYKWTKIKGKLRLLPTPTLGHSIMGGHLFDNEKPCVAICEGPWDAIKLYEVLNAVKETEEGALVPTANRENSLGAVVNVIGIPGVNSFCEEWTQLCSEKEVWLLFDNDYEKTNDQGHKIAPAALVGTQRTAAMLHAADNPPERIMYAAWGGDSQWSTDWPQGFDIRDMLLSLDNGDRDAKG